MSNIDANARPADPAIELLTRANITVVTAVGRAGYKRAKHPLNINRAECATWANLVATVERMGQLIGCQYIELYLRGKMGCYAGTEYGEDGVLIYAYSVENGWVDVRLASTQTEVA